LPGFTKETDLTFIAATLIVVDYSINDAVVVFDRLRENRMGESGKLRQGCERW
jgi:preprotein translocase subunit SecF